jgi:hypothetical protein
MESESKNNTADEFEHQIIDNILLKDDLGNSIQDLLLNNLLSKENKLREGMTTEDFDIIFSTQEAINKEILHTLIVVPNKYDQKTKYCQLLKKEEVKFTEDKYDEFNKLVKNHYKSFKIMLTPRIRRNLRFDFTVLKYKIIIDGKTENYQFKHESKDKDILCLISHKLKKDPKNPHKFGKQLQILEQLQDPNLREFWDYYQVVYMIFCVQNEERMKTEYEKFPKEMKEVHKNFKNVKIIFFLDQELNRDIDANQPKLRNIFLYNNYGKNYFFLMDPEYKIYRSDNMLFSGDIVEEAIANKKKEKENKTKDQEELKRERYKAFLDLYDFYTKLTDFKYALYFSAEFEICLKYNEAKKSFFISYIDFYKIAADLRPDEYKKVRDWTKILKPEDVEDVREIELFDIPVDFTNNKCKVCKKEIGKDEPMYYCYKCAAKDKYCHDCVIKHYRNKDNIGKKKFIDPEHNLLFFKTRNENSFKQIDKFKLGTDLFKQYDDEKQFENFQRLCYGCKRKFNESPRYICLNCNKGTLIYGRYHDYCINCIEHMMKNDEEGKKIQDIQERIYGYETRTLLTNNEVYKHSNDEHVYLMIALEIKDKNDF